MYGTLITLQSSHKVVMYTCDWWVKKENQLCTCRDHVNVSDPSKMLFFSPTKTSVWSSRLDSLTGVYVVFKKSSQYFNFFFVCQSVAQKVSVFNMC